MVSTDSWVTHFSEGIIKTPGKNHSTKLQRKLAQNHTIGTDLFYQIRPACNSPSHCCAICIALHCFILWGSRGKKGHFFKEQYGSPATKGSSRCKLFRLGKPFFQQSRLEERGGFVLGRKKAVLCAGCSLLCRWEGLQGESPWPGQSLPCPERLELPVGWETEAEGAASSPPSLLTRKRKNTALHRALFQPKVGVSEIKIIIFQSLQSHCICWGGKKQMWNHISTLWG